MVYEGKYYGTLKSELKRIWKNKQIPVMDIDVQGAIHVQKEYPINSLFIFIQPPSVDELKKAFAKHVAQKLWNHLMPGSINLHLSYHLKIILKTWWLIITLKKPVLKLKIL